MGKASPEAKAYLQRLVREAIVGEISDETMARVAELFRQALGGDVPDEALRAAEDKHGAHLTRTEAAHLTGVPPEAISKERVSRVELRNLATKPDGQAAQDAWDVKNAAQYLGISEKTLYRLAAEGSVPSYKVGGARCFDPSALAAWRTKQVRGGR